MRIHIDDEYLTCLLSDLVDIPSIVPDEREVMLFLERELWRAGLTPQRIPVEEGRFNLLCRVGEGSPVFCLNAHSDTVQACGDSIPKARIEGDILSGLGSADDKGSIAAMVAAVRAVRESGIRLNGTLDLLISVDEEGGARGVRAATEQGYRCDFAVVGEPTSLEIVPTHCGQVCLEIITHGRSAHGSMPMEGVNAIEMMCDLVSGLRAAVTDYPAHPLIGPPTLNLGMLRGGDRPNRVPDRCEASVDIRIVPPMTDNSIIELIGKYFGSRISDCGLESGIEYRVVWRRGALETPVDSPLVRALSDAADGVLGHAPEIVGWRGWTEAQSFSSALGINALVFGPGSLKQAHSADEFVDLKQVKSAARIYAETALRILSGGSD